MRELRPLFTVALGLGLSGTAWALPWNIDLVDGAQVKGYEREMAPLPEGVMSQPHLLTPIAYRPNHAWTSDARTTLVNPLDVTDEVIATGATMYDAYCWPCHGDGVQLGPVSDKGYPAVAVLGGDQGRMQNLPDGHVYLTIRNGSISKLMPAYGYGMSDDEMWALVAWMRAKLPNATYNAPPAAETEAN